MLAGLTLCSGLLVLATGGPAEVPADAAEPALVAEPESAAPDDVPPSEPPAGSGDAGASELPPAEGEPSTDPGVPVAEPGDPAEPESQPDPEPQPLPDPDPQPDPQPESQEISAVMDALEPTPLPPLPPKHRLVYKNLFAARYNPLGLVNDNAIGWAMRLYDKRGALYESAYVGAKVHTYVSPAYSRIGPQLEFSPLAILNLSATYDFTGYYGTFNQMQSFATPAADYSDTQLEENDENGASYATYGHLVTLSALLQAKVGPVAVRSNFKAYYNNFNLRGDGKSFYDQTLDILVPNDGWAMTNDLDLLYLFDFGLKLGARYTVTHSVYKDKHFQAGEPVTQPNGPTHRIGPAVLYTFYDKPTRRFNKPTLILLTQWWARHRYRTGEDVSGAVPYVVLGFLFEGDLLPDPRKRK